MKSIPYPKELEEVNKEYIEAREQIKNDLPSGDLRAKKLFAIDKVPDFVIHAEKHYLLGHPIEGLVCHIRDIINDVLAMAEKRATILPPPRFKQKELWEQLDLPFNPPLK